MPLDESTLATAIANAFATAQGLGNNPSAAQTSLGSTLASAIVTCIKTGSVQITPAEVTAATMVAGGAYPVVAASDLYGTIS